MCAEDPDKVLSPTRERLLDKLLLALEELQLHDQVAADIISEPLLPVRRVKHDHRGK